MAGKQDAFNCNKKKTKSLGGKQTVCFKHQIEICLSATAAFIGYCLKIYTVLGRGYFCLSVCSHVDAHMSCCWVCLSLSTEFPWGPKKALHQ